MTIIINSCVFQISQIRKKVISLPEFIYETKDTESEEFSGFVYSDEHKKKIIESMKKETGFPFLKRLVILISLCCKIC